MTNLRKLKKLLPFLFMAAVLLALVLYGHEERGTSKPRESVGISQVTAIEKAHWVRSPVGKLLSISESAGG